MNKNIEYMHTQLPSILSIYILSCRNLYTVDIMLTNSLSATLPLMTRNSDTPCDFEVILALVLVALL